MTGFSIVIPMYNVQDYIEECLKSILSQDYNNYEIICVNDGSTDNSLQIVEKIKCDKIRIINQDNLGLSAARNVGLANATRDFIWFVDSDDFISQDALIKLDQVLSNEKLEVLGFNYLQWFNDDLATHLKLTQIDGVISGSEYIDRCEFFLPMAWIYVYERKFLAKHNHKFRVGIYHEDDYFNISLFGHISRIKNISEVLYFYRMRPASITSANDLIVYKKRIFSYFQLLKLVKNINGLSPAFLIKKKEAYIRNIFLLLNSLIKSDENILQLRPFVNQIKMWMKEEGVLYPVKDKFSLIRKLLFVNTRWYIMVLKRFNI